MMLLDVLLAVVFSYEFVIIMTCFTCILLFIIEYLISENRKDKDNA